MDRKNSKLNNFIVQGGILAITGVLVRVLGLAKRIPLRYIIGDIGNSYYATAFNIYNIVLTVAVYGIPLSVSKLVSARVAQKQYKNANRVFKCAMCIATVSGLLGSVFVFIFSEQLANLFKKPLAYLPLRVLAPTIFVVALLAVLRGYFQGLGTMIPSAISQLIEQIVLIIVSLSAAYFFTARGEKVGLIKQNPLFKYSYGAAGATLGCVISALFGLTFMVFLYKAYYRREKRKILRDPTIEVESVGQIFKVLILTIVPVVISSTVNNLSNTTDEIIHNNILARKGLTESMTLNWGIYSGMYLVLIGIPIAFAASMGASSVPAISGTMIEKNYEDAKEKIGRVIRITMMVAIPCATGMAVLAPSIMYTLFSTNSPMAALLVRIGATGVVLFSLSTLTNGILQAMNRLIKPITHGLIALALHSSILALLLYFTDMQIYAVALSNNFLSLFICIMNIFSISKILGYKQEVKNTFILPIVSSAVMGLVVFLLDKLVCANGVSRIFTIVNIVIGGIVYFLIMLISKGITKNELMAIPGGTRIYGVARKLHLMK